LEDEEEGKGRRRVASMTEFGCSGQGLASELILGIWMPGVSGDI